MRAQNNSFNMSYGSEINLVFLESPAARCSVFDFFFLLLLASPERNSPVRQSTGRFLCGGAAQWQPRVPGAAHGAGGEVLSVACHVCLVVCDSDAKETKKCMKH